MTYMHMHNLHYIWKGKNGCIMNVKNDEKLLNYFHSRLTGKVMRVFGAATFLGLGMLPVSTKLECHFLWLFFVGDFLLNFVENVLCAIVTDRI